MALKGNLRDVGLAQLFNLIHLARKTGALTVTRDNGPGTARLYFKEGRLVHVVPDGSSARLTDVLLKSGKLTPDQAKSVRARARSDTDKDLGVLMIQSGVLSQNDIVQGVKSYMLESVYHLFTWTGGTFRFEPNQLPPEERVTIPVNLENLIMEGGRRVREWDRLRGELPDLDVPLRFSQRPEANLRSVSLSVDQWKVVSFINSRSTMRQIAGYLKIDEFQIRRIVNGLRSAGLVEIGTPIAPPPPPRPILPALGARVSRNVILRVIDRIRGL